ncbi:MAG: hypothetical protein DI598_04400 [Pseudopedobacter saltans]|uniref:Uncharacterized protein n=1 Tax=Pseudopedobacter saltans TaxID=151895 RepID=A0A2W5F6B8_9SPHI|nr:MAG: hypothetical protein DI598_04400 [Pseudopedobacter saltans]
MGYAFPLGFKFKISTIANDFVATDNNGSVIAYVRQKMFKLVDHIQVFTDESKSQVKYDIRANKWLDFSATYTFTDQMNNAIGRVARKGWKSTWKAHYEIFDTNDNHEYTIQEVNPWVRVMDSFTSEIPVVSLFTGYMFHPKYRILDNKGSEVALLKKESSFFGRKFSVDKLQDLADGDQERILLSLMMMILLERRRG